MRPEPLDRALEAVVEVDGWLPTEQATSQGDVRLADGRVVFGAGHEGDLAARPHQIADRPCQVEDRELAGVADIDRAGVLGPQ
jgi:hypothetical protein